MTSLLIQQGKDTPFVSFDTDSNIFEIAGESYNPTPQDFYEPIIQWLEKYLPQNHRPVTVNLELQYFNTTTYPELVKILDILTHHQQYNKVTINWMSDAENLDIIQDGEFLKTNFGGLNFRVVAA